MRARRGDLERAARDRLPAHLGEVGSVALGPDRAGRGGLCR